MQTKVQKTSTKTHRRSRTGCFTCRLRRKKCDEGKPICKACRHLGLQCEYKRPTWWANVDQRKRQKEAIKILIKRTKLAEKMNSQSISPALSSSADSPPELLSRGSIQTSSSDSSCTSDNLIMNGRRRSLSIESGYSLECELEDGLIGHGMAGLGLNISLDPYGPGSHDLAAFHYQQPFNPFGNNPFAPFDVAALSDPKEMTGFGFPPRKQSIGGFPGTVIRRHSASGGVFSVMPQDTTTTPFIPVENIHLADNEAVDPSFFDFSFPGAGQLTPSSTISDGFFESAVATQSPYIPVDDGDRMFLDHFLCNVVKSIFPVLDQSLNGQTRQEIIMPSLATNKSYMHCCLSIAAQHLKATQNISPEYIDQDIMRHRYATISSLCEALKEDTHHLEILEATMAMILFQCSVGSSEDGAATAFSSLPDIPWHSHFQAAVSLVQKLNLPIALEDIPSRGAISSMATNMPGPAQYNRRPFNMSLTSWVDILGATMLGRAPVFADTYREKHLRAGHSGLQEIMGCDDQVMYLISEIACLEALKAEKILTDMELCEHVKSLAAKIDLTEDMAAASVVVGAPQPSVHRQDGSIDKAALHYHLTAAFRYAARIYLCSLVPGFDRNQIQVRELLDKLAATMEKIPTEFDKCLVWVYLIAGSVATEGSLFRELVSRRDGAMIAMGGPERDCGNWAKMIRLVMEVWRVEDSAANGGMKVVTETSCTWRDIMRVNGWDWLLI